MCRYQNLLNFRQAHNRHATLYEIYIQKHMYFIYVMLMHWCTLRIILLAYAYAFFKQIKNKTQYNT